MKAGTPITDLRSRKPLTLSVGLRLRRQLCRITKQHRHSDWLEPQFDPLKVWSLQSLWLLDDLFDATITTQAQ